jgi:hypothetical protein
MSWRTRAAYIVAGTVLGASLIVANLGLAPSARANECDSTFSIVPADGSFSWSLTPTCDNTAEPNAATPSDLVIETPDGAIVTPSGSAVVTGPSATGYTSPGNTPYVNGAPDRSPYSNVSQYTPNQAAGARAQSNPSATANAYSQYGGFTPPGNTATHNSPPAVVLPSR